MEKENSVLERAYHNFCWACDEVLDDSRESSGTYQDTRNAIGHIDYSYYLIDDKVMDKPQRFALHITTSIDDDVFENLVDYVFAEFVNYQDFHSGFHVCDFAEERLTLEFANTSTGKKAFVDFKPNFKD